MEVTARSMAAWSRLPAVAAIVALLVAGSIANHLLEVTTGPVEVQFANLPPGWHHVVISAENGYRRVLTTGVADGSFGDGNVPSGVTARVAARDCSII